MAKSLGFEWVGTFRQVGRKFNRWLDVAFVQIILNGEERHVQEKLQAKL